MPSAEEIINLMKKYKTSEPEKYKQYIEYYRKNHPEFYKNHIIPAFKDLQPIKGGPKPVKGKTLTGSEQKTQEKPGTPKNLNQLGKEVKPLGVPEQKSEQVQASEAKTQKPAESAKKALNTNKSGEKKKTNWVKIILIILGVLLLGGAIGAAAYFLLL